MLLHPKAAGVARYLYKGGQRRPVVNVLGLACWRRVHLRRSVSLGVAEPYRGWRRPRCSRTPPTVERRGRLYSPPARQHQHQHINGLFDARTTPSTFLRAPRSTLSPDTAAGEVGPERTTDGL